jgi:hypothetical protein
MLALWSAFEAKSFSRRLADCGFEIDVKRVRAHDGSSQRHVLWLARPTG